MAIVSCLVYPEYFTQFSELQINVVSQIRLPLFVLAVLVGAILAQTGAATQALCRNPLADPSIIGISGGGCNGVAVSPHQKWGLILMFICPMLRLGALLVTLAVYKFAKRNNEINVTTLILVGVAFNALSFALIGFKLLPMIPFTTDQLLDNGVAWWRSWSGIAQTLPFLLLVFWPLLNKRA